MINAQPGSSVHIDQIKKSLGADGNHWMSWPQWEEWIATVSEQELIDEKNGQLDEIRFLSSKRLSDPYLKIGLLTIGLGYPIGIFVGGYWMYWLMWAAYPIILMLTFSHLLVNSESQQRFSDSIRSRKIIIKKINDQLWRYNL